VCTPGFGGGPHVKVIDGTKPGLVGPDGAIAPSAVLASFFAYDPAFRGGVTVTVSDVDGDGKADIVTGTGPGGGAHVKVFSGASLGQGRPAELASFFAFDPSFRGGVNVAAGDVDGDGRADIVTAAASGGGSHVKVFNGLGGQPLLRSFFAYGASFGGGVSVAAGDVNGDGLADIITGAGVGGGPHVKVFDSRGAELASFFGLTGGAAGADVAYRVARDGTPLVVVGGQTNGSQVRTFAAPDFRPYNGFDAYEPSFLGGVEVG
ncbi:VCBS repeat-containing protein, partial [bacterium]|nr:VCBS repeat-containing protein [bacterium]